MPQLDKVTFIAQISWLLPIFFIFYIALVRWVLPTVATTLKLRSRAVKVLSSDSTAIHKEAFELLDEHQSLKDIMKNPSVNFSNKLVEGFKFEKDLVDLNIHTGLEFSESTKNVFDQLVSFYLINSLAKLEK